MKYNPRDLRSPVSAVILDFGGVLGLPQDLDRAARMASLCGVSREEFSALYRRDRLELDRGTLSSGEYWTRILRAAGRLPTDGLIAQIEAEDLRAWIRINRRVVDWAAELRAAGFATAILSNMPSDKLAYMRGLAAFRWIDEFPVTVFSCDHHLVKPEPAIYRLCLDLLGEAPEKCLFLDDSPANVEGGRAAGIPGILFRSAEQVAAVLSGTWGLPVRSLMNATEYLGRIEEL